ncbi:hypothetical protein CXT76_00955 [Candidatus Parvarchaeota archaeon]|jgi:Cys-tRNA synthase (O-phospho-L-seryl-tRNA:Cys-tRNA synthase)|nr:MAG: hypothetical protein CXT76_00955 [Candidatus Parvarchaeota archaeon]HIG51959.1 hypothetical protein [Candidatus Pacearchaeota archaeon]
MKILSVLKSKNVWDNKSKYYLTNHMDPYKEDKRKLYFSLEELIDGIKEFDKKRKIQLDVYGLADEEVSELQEELLNRKITYKLRDKI